MECALRRRNISDILELSGGVSGIRSPRQRKEAGDVRGESRGLPGEFLLLTTVLIWLLFTVVFLGNRKSKINQWCFISGLLYSVGALKEYLYYTLFPWLMEMSPAVLDSAGALDIYSVLTAIPYYFATPALLVMALYFSRVELRYPRLFPWASIAAFLPGLILGCVYPFADTRYYQLNDKTYYGIVICYNLVFALTATALFVRALRRERNAKVKRQKLAIASLVLLPGWFTILTTMPVQFFGVRGAEKAWQGNFLIIIALILVWLFMVMNDGFMGSRLKHETYRWDQEERLMGQTMDMVRHMLKNQIAKIDWCAKNIAGKAEDPEMNTYAGIILRSTGRMSEFLVSSRERGREAGREPEPVEVLELLRRVLDDFEKRYTEINFEVRCGPGKFLFCDCKAVREVLVNLFQNGAEAMGERGRMIVEFREGRGRFSSLKIADTGGGFPEEIRDQMFNPYVSTKTGDTHWGLGLYYCQKVMRDHGGRIQADNSAEGAVFTLWFPRKRRKKGMGARYGDGKDSGSDCGR